jgi:voltage-gated potassium channel
MMKEENTRKTWPEVRQSLFRMVSVGIVDIPINQAYDVISTAALLVNLVASIANTFQSVHILYGPVLEMIEAVTVAFFAIDYVLRVVTAKCLYPDDREGISILRYMFSFAGIIDLLSFFPYYLPFFFPAGAAVFRMFRVARIMRLFRINAYYDSLNVITEVLVSKKQQLLSSIYIIMILMMGSSLCMYSLEHEAQPDVFSNAFSGIWWSASTLLTVGYGDIYPVTTLGQFFGIVISFLGVGMVAIPTGIISAGFVEQYSRLKRLGDYGMDEDIEFVELLVKPKDKWVGKRIGDLGLPKSALVIVVIRGKETIIARSDIILQPNDVLVLGAANHRSDHPVNLKEIKLEKEHPWTGQKIRDLDISRQTIIVSIKRNGRFRIPHGDMTLMEADRIYLYTKVKIHIAEPGEE